MLKDLAITFAGGLLWKGKRNLQLEELFIKALEPLCDRGYWQLFVEMDNCFETIAADGDLRLARSQAA